MKISWEQVLLTFTYSFVFLISFSGKTSEKTVDKSAWLENFQKNFSKGLCHEVGYIHRCYGIRNSACRSYINSFTKLCSAKVEIPEKFHPYHGVSIGYQLGKCVGKALHDKNIDRYNKNDEICTDYHRW